jgi:type IV fimbrial biogenesis protein FimT
MLNKHTRSRVLQPRGFTLLELMVSISMLGVVTAIAAPKFATFVANAHIRANANMLHTALFQARSYALTHQTTVIVCAAATPGLDACEQNRQANKQWHYGLILFADNNANNRLDATDHLIRQLEINNKVQVVFNQRGRLRFFADGHARSAGFYVCGEKSKKEAYLRLLHTGRARISGKLNKKQRARCLGSS